MAQFFGLTTPHYGARVSIVLGIGAALTIGLSDAFGRASSRRSESSITHVISQMFIGTFVALPFIFVIDSAFIWGDVISGAASGVFVALGLAIVYRSMADSSSAVTLPLAGVMAILVPLLFDIATGARIGWITGVGMGIAIISLMVVSFDPALGTEKVRRGLGLALGGGALFGLTFLFAGTTSEASGAWPAVFNRGVGFVGISVVALKSGAPFVLDRPSRVFGVAGGFAGSLGMLCLILGAQVGSLAVVSVLAGSSPAVTVIATALFDDDQVSWWQMLGIGGAITGTALIAIG